MTTFFDRRVRTRPVRLDGFPPALAGDLAFRRFCMPQWSARRAPDHVMLAERARYHLRKARWVSVPTTDGLMQAYVFEPDPGTTPRGGVLLVHGWTGESSFMAVFAEQLRRAGFRVVAFDQPAHGKSAKARASLVDCSRAVIAVAEALGPLRFAIAHSMGALAVLHAGEGGSPMPRAYPFERYVLVAAPNRFGDVTREFADELGLGWMARRAYERHLERLAHRSLGAFTSANLLAATGKPVLLLHSRDDLEVPFQRSEEIVAAYPKAELRAYDSLGHRNILFASSAIRAAVSYLLAAD